MTTKTFDELDKQYAYSPIQVTNVIPLHDHVLVTGMNFEERKTAGGIVIMSDNMKSSGIRPRWAKVFAVGPNQLDVTKDQYVLVAHGRWTRGIKIKMNDIIHVIRRIDPNDILAVSDEPQIDDTMSDKVLA